MLNIKEDFILIFKAKKIVIPKGLTEKEQQEYKNRIYKRKKELHEKLGALKFRELVFKLEKIKFKVMKKICLNFISYYEKWCDFNTKRMLKKAKNNNEAELIEFNNKLSKLKMRKEWNKEENRNYHLDNKSPSQIINYLNWNKMVHQNNLKKDAIIIPILWLGTYFFFPFALPLLIFSCGSVFINLQCINLQEHSIAKYELYKKVLIKKEQRNLLKQKKEHIKAKKMMGNIILKNRKILTVEEIVENIKTKEQAEQIREWALSMLNKNNMTDFSKKKVK